MKGRWPFVHLLDVATYSKAGEVIDKSFWNKGSEILYTCAKEPVRSDFPNFPEKKRTIEGDILLARNGYGYAYYPPPGSIYTNVVQRIQLDTKKAVPKYVWYVLNAQLGKLRGVGQGIPSLNISVWNALDLPLPPLHIQSKLVATFDDAERLRSKQALAGQLLSDFATAMFYKMYGDSGKNERRWKQVPLGDVCDLINGKPFKPSDWLESGTPIIRIQNLNDKTKPYNYYHGELPEKFRVRDGDILLSWSGTPGTSFGCFIWDGPEGWLNQHIFNVHLKSKEICKMYFVHAVNSKLGELIQKAHGGVGLQHVTKGVLENVLIALPPIELQNEFAARIDEVQKITESQVKTGKLINEVFQALTAELV